MMWVVDHSQHCSDADVVLQTMESKLPVPPSMSLAGTGIEKISQNLTFDRSITIMISNCSQKYILIYPKFYTVSGYSELPPPPTIHKGTVEVCSFIKTSGAARGAVGVLTYDICQHDETDWVAQLAIMFSVPYDYRMYNSWFALGIFKDRVPCDENLFNQMYYESGPFTRAEATGARITFNGKYNRVDGTMSPSGTSTMKVELLPPLWMTAEVRDLLKPRDSAFKAGDKAPLRKAWPKQGRPPLLLMTRCCVLQQLT
ncbi:hypothetical protein NFI96_007143 [Prochilodus magdalenae]|nr:hypothetical protein NFI96_007143 [Prochilodus magdalenae]